MSQHVHDFTRLSDVAVFCKRCGEIKTVAEAICSRPHYQPGWVYYPPTYPTPAYPWWYGTVTSGDITSGDITVGSVTTLDLSTQATYTGGTS